MHGWERASCMHVSFHALYTCLQLLPHFSSTPFPAHCPVFFFSKSQTLVSHFKQHRFLVQLFLHPCRYHFAPMRAESFNHTSTFSTPFCPSINVLKTQPSWFWCSLWLNILKKLRPWICPYSKALLVEPAHFFQINSCYKQFLWISIYWLIHVYILFLMIYAEFYTENFTIPKAHLQLWIINIFVFIRILFLNIRFKP